MKRFALLAGAILIILVTALVHTGEKKGVELPPPEENLVPSPSREGLAWENEAEEEILVQVFESSYRTAEHEVGDGV